MKRLIPAIIFLLSFLLAVQSNAQFYQVPYLIGTQTIGGINVTTTAVGNGTPNGSYNSPSFCGYGLNAAYHVGGCYATLGYKFSFSKAVTRVRMLFHEMIVNDNARFFVNGNRYNITSANLSYPTMVCATYPAIASGGDLWMFTNGNCFNGQVDINPGILIDSFTVVMPLTGYPNGCGSEVIFQFASDTFVYVKSSFADTVKCSGDTLKVPYIVSNTFATGNSFTVQLSNASGSFAAPTVIGTKTATTNDSVVCVLPKTLAGGTGYRVRIVSSNPVNTSPDNGVNIRIKPLAANRTTGNNNPCEPDTLRLTSSTTSSPVTYAWAGPNSFSSTLQNPKIGGTSSSLSSGNYMLTTTFNGCSVTDTMAVTVKPLPAKPTVGSNTPLCTGATINLTSTTATSGVTYSWTGPNSFTATSQNPSKLSATTADAGNFIVTVTLNGCIAKDTETVVVYPPTGTPTAGNTGPYCIGSDIKLSAGTMAGATYTWSGPNGFTSNLQNPTIIAAGLNAAGTYSVYATVNGCNSNTATTTVSIVAGPTVVAYASPNDSICFGTTVTFTALPANPGSGASYLWLKNGIALPGSNALSFPVSGLIDGDVISFLLTPGTGAACTTPVNSNFITMTVRQYQQPIVEMQASDTTVWPGLLVNFNVTNASGGANPAYQWKVNNQNIVGATSNVWGTTQLQDNDKVCVVMSPDFLCANPSTASACVTMHVSTGVNQLANTQLKVYPNPAKETLTIEGLEGNTSIQLIDVLGRVVYTTVGAGTITIPTKQLSNGNYVLKLTAADGKNTVVNVSKE